MTYSDLVNRPHFRLKQSSYVSCLNCNKPSSLDSIVIVKAVVASFLSRNKEPVRSGDVTHAACTECYNENAKLVSAYTSCGKCPIEGFMTHDYIQFTGKVNMNYADKMKKLYADLIERKITEAEYKASMSVVEAYYDEEIKKGASEDLPKFLFERYEAKMSRQHCIDRVAYKKK
jgi:hypothetical protein